jgi:GrpB-like predicted nucleotidyltransferase (UPF0157 family)
MVSPDKDATRLTGADREAHEALAAEEARRGKVPSSVIDETITVELASHRWTSCYAAEACRLREVLPVDLVPALEHIGSTSVQGLDAKPIIDIMAGISDPHRIAEMADILGSLSYESLGEAGVPGRWAFRYRADPRAFNISVVAWDGERWRVNLAVRDHLRNDPVATQQYAAAKWAGDTFRVFGCQAICD